MTRSPRGFAMCLKFQPLHLGYNKEAPKLNHIEKSEDRCTNVSCAFPTTVYHSIKFVNCYLLTGLEINWPSVRPADSHSRWQLWGKNKTVHQQLTRRPDFSVLMDRSNLRQGRRLPSDSINLNYFGCYDAFEAQVAAAASEETPILYSIKWIHQQNVWTGLRKWEISIADSEYQIHDLFGVNVE